MMNICEVYIVRFMAGLLLLSLTCAVSSAAEHASDKAPEISAGVDKAERKYKATYDKIIESGYKKLKKEKVKYMAVIEKDIKAQMRKSDLAAANALNEHLKLVQAANPIADTFKEQRQVKTKRQKSGIYITKAMAYQAGKGHKEIDVRIFVQNYVEQGHTSLRASDFLSEETGIRRSARLTVEWTFEGKKYAKTSLWFGDVNLIAGERE